MLALTSIFRDYPVGDQVVHALRNITIEVEDGEYLSIMGPSGSGKSTLLNIIGLLDSPDSGSYRLRGEDTARMSDDRLARTRREVIGFVFQFFHLVPRLTAFENVELPLTLAGWRRRKRREKVKLALERVELSDRMEHRPNQLSGGQLQRVAIARSIVMAPGLLLADEPTGNLDEGTGESILQLLLELSRDAGKTLIMATHDQDIADLADAVYFLERGQLVSHLSPVQGAPPKSDATDRLRRDVNTATAQR